MKSVKALLLFALVAVSSTAVVDANRRLSLNLKRFARGAKANDSLESLDAPSKDGSTTILATRGGGGTLKVSTGFTIVAGMMLAFNSGYVNGACLSGLLSSEGVKQASAAVTGAWTNSALGVASGNSKQFLFNAKCLLCYVTGSFISGLLNPTPVPYEIATGPVASLFLIGAALLFGSSHIAGTEGTKPFIYLAAIANGLQNSITSTTTANMCRTAHFSGCSSDMGTFLGQVLRGNKANLLKLKVFIGLALSFWTGGYVSYHVTSQFASSSLLFSAGLYLAIALYTATAGGEKKA